MNLKMPRGIDKSITYYIAGPMSGIENYNYPAFETAAQRLEAHGLIVKSPHRIPWPDKDMLNEELWQYTMRFALAMLLECQGIVLLQGWTRSRGAVIEASIASALQMPMYFLDGDYLVPMHTVEAGSPGQ